MKNKLFERNGRILSSANRSLRTCQFALRPVQRLGGGSDEDWEVIKQISKAFEGVDDSMLGQRVMDLIISSAFDSKQLESACLNLNYLASSVKFGLDNYIRLHPTGDYDFFANGFNLTICLVLL